MSEILSNLSSNLEPLHALSYQTNRADFAYSFLVGLLVLGPAEGTVLFLLPSVDGLVGRRTNVERVELVVLQLVLVRWGLVACLKKNQNRTGLERINGNLDESNTSHGQIRLVELH